MKHFGGAIKRIGQRLLLAAGMLFVVQTFFVLTGPPKFLKKWLNAEDLSPKIPPRYVVVLGGGGIPSESGLIRTYCAAEYGLRLTNTTFIVSLPSDANPETTSVGRMRDELVRRGIPANAVRLEYHGLNTHQQAQQIRLMLGDIEMHAPIVLVSSEFHLQRAVLTFRKQGFTSVSALNAQSIGAEAEAGPWTWLRYGIWANLADEAKIVREFIALLAYKVRGWI